MVTGVGCLFGDPWSILALNPSAVNVVTWPVQNLHYTKEKLNSVKKEWMNESRGAHGRYIITMDYKVRCCNSFIRI